MGDSPKASDRPAQAEGLPELVPGGGEDAAEANGDQEELDEELDEEAQALLKELESSQAEVERLLSEQRLQTSELGGLKESLAAELGQLQDEAWKMQMYSELEMLKHQLAAIAGIGSDLDVLQKKMDDMDEEEETALADQEATLGEGDAAEGAAEELGEDLEGIEALQDDLDAELAAMQKQLDAIRAESAAVTQRKKMLEEELYQLLQEGVDDMGEQLEQMALNDGGAGNEGAAGSPAPAEAPSPAAAATAQ